MNVDYFKAKDGHQAVEKVEAHLQNGKMFDIILMDLYMPNMNGYQATEGIRQLEERFNILPGEKHFICAHSSELSRQNEVACFKVGIDDVVAKPISVKSLQRMLTEHDRRFNQPLESTMKPKNS